MNHIHGYIPQRRNPVRYWDTLRGIHFTQPAEKAIRALAALFEIRHRTVEVQVSVQTTDIVQSLEATPAHELPHAMRVDHEISRFLLERGLVDVEATERLYSHLRGTVQDVGASFRNFWLFGSRSIAVPTDGCVYGMWYRKDLGLARPTSIDQLFTLVKQLDGTSYRVGLPDVPSVYAEHFLRFMGASLGLGSRIASAEAAALKEITELYLDLASCSSVQRVSELEARRGLVGGSLALGFYSSVLMEYALMENPAILDTLEFVPRVGYGKSYATICGVSLLAGATFEAEQWCQFIVAGPHYADILTHGYPASSAPTRWNAAIINEWLSHDFFRGRESMAWEFLKTLHGAEIPGFEDGEFMPEAARLFEELLLSESVSAKLSERFMHKVTA